MPFERDNEAKRGAEGGGEVKYKIGETLHRCVIDGDTGRPSRDIYRVRSIRGGKVHAVMINDLTWVKLKWGKDQTRGWALVIDPVYRMSCREGERFSCLHRTEGAALRQAKQWHQQMIERLARYELAEARKGVAT